MATAPVPLTPAQKLFFETFGYVVLPGAMRDEIGWIIEEFEAAWASLPPQHDGSRRTTFPGVMAMATPKLQTLFDHPVVVGALDTLFGPGWNHEGGDGNFYSGDTNWHSDLAPTANPWRDKTTCRHIKVAFYLDQLTRDTGALRVIPGSHLWGDQFTQLLHDADLWDPQPKLGISGKDVPSVALETTPGDLALFDHRLKHASFGGSTRRRMFTLNTFAPCHTPEAREGALEVMRYYRDREHVDWRYWIDVAAQWPAERARHLQGINELAQVVIAEAQPAGTPIHLHK